ncbi:hypothetical protein BV898_12569 [Hypsibius exemplaris]|uniref:Uncharacterized protein n=1 Tax=Hypsibius exemplaris TaxID=2072580 RepID=A0A1W0WDH3_HYPEX|nr:hypothetical protein BV898_12569 [Hypsibius exemplaris]
MDEPIGNDINDELYPVFRLLGEYGFDGMFILKWCLVNGIIPQKQIMNGIKIMQMDICNLILGIKLRIRCSYWNSVKAD